MKNILNKFVIFAFVLSLLSSCEEPDNVVYDVIKDVQYGAVIRTLDRVSVNYNLFDLDSNFELKIETQDEQYGDLLDKVNVYVSYVDKADDGVDNNKAEILLKSLEKSVFTESANGLPSTSFSSTFGETLDALGLVAGQYFGGDNFIFRLELVLTDGRVFSANSSSANLQGSYFNSPFMYRANILCVPAVPFAGDYRVDMHDAYGDGWQGSHIVLSIDGVDQIIKMGNVYDGDPGPFDNTTVTVNIPEGSTSAVWSFVAGSWPSEVTFEIWGPNSGQIIGAYGPSPVEGELALDLCNE